MSSVQNPLTIPVNSHSLPPCFRGLGFGFRGEMHDGWHFRGASATLPRRSVFRGMFSAHPIMTLNMHKRFRGASAKRLSILTSARPSAVLPRLHFQLPRRYWSRRLWKSEGNLVLGGFDRCCGNLKQKTNFSIHCLSPENEGLNPFPHRILQRYEKVCALKQLATCLPQILQTFSVILAIASVQLDTDGFV